MHNNLVLISSCIWDLALSFFSFMLFCSTVVCIKFYSSTLTFYSIVFSTNIHYVVQGRLLFY